MKIVGIILIGFGCALLLFVGYTYIKSKNRMVSPIPEEQGIKVIFVSPSPSQ